MKSLTPDSDPPVVSATTFHEEWCLFMLDALQKVGKDCLPPLVKINYYLDVPLEVRMNG